MEWIQKIATVLLRTVSDPFGDSKVWDDTNGTDRADHGEDRRSFFDLVGLEQKPLERLLMFLDSRMKARAMIASKYIYQEAADGMFELDLFRQNDMGYDQIRSFIGRSHSRRWSVTSLKVGASLETAEQLTSLTTWQPRLTRFELHSRVCSGNLLAVTRLSELMYLNLTGCAQMNGSLGQLQGLVKLQVLNLSYCEKITGSIQALEKAIDLEELNLAWCEHISGDTDAFANMTRLKELNLTNCRDVSGSLSSFAKLTELRELNLWNCSGLTGALDQVSCMRKLRTLKLYKCITLEGTLEPLEGLNDLKVLNLGSTADEPMGLSGKLMPLGELKSLTELILCHCHLVEGNIQPLFNLERLEILDLSGCSRLNAHRAKQTLKKLMPTTIINF